MEGVSTATGLVTVTSQFAVNPPSVVAIMVTFPGAFAVTFPSLTEAIFSSLEDHSTVSVLDSSGDKVATRTSLDPTSKVMFFFDNSMFVAKGITA